jgi:hypothetical protein
MTSVILALDVAWGAESGQASVVINYRTQYRLCVEDQRHSWYLMLEFASDDRRSPTRRQYQ